MAAASNSAINASAPGLMGTLRPVRTEYGDSNRFTYRSNPHTNRWEEEQGHTFLYILGVVQVMSLQALGFLFHMPLISNQLSDID